MGDKRQPHSKGKTGKTTKHGLRPHEQREQDAAKTAPPTTPSTGGKPPRS
jgi:hypothetical protein